MNPKYLRFRNDLENSLALKLKNQRIYVLIDAANLYHSSVKKGMRIDFLQLYKWFWDKCDGNLVIKFYTAYSPENEKQIEFLTQLTEAGFEVVKKPIKSFENSIKGNMDIELAVDAMTTIDLFDTLVLVSGDGDFTYLINSLEKNYKKTIVLGVGGFTSYELHLVADSYFFLDRISKMWKTPSSAKAVDNKQAQNNNSKLTLSTDDFEKAYVQNVLHQDYNSDPNQIGLNTPILPAKQELKFPPHRIKNEDPESTGSEFSKPSSKPAESTQPLLFESKPTLYLEDQPEPKFEKLLVPTKISPPPFDPELVLATKKSFSQSKRIQTPTSRTKKSTNPFPNSANYTKLNPKNSL